VRKVRKAGGKGGDALAYRSSKRKKKQPRTAFLPCFLSHPFLPSKEGENMTSISSRSWVCVGGRRKEA